MTLETALKDIIKLYGVCILTSTQLINILADYQVFVDNPSLKIIIRTMIEERMVAQISQNAYDKDSLSKLLENFNYKLHCTYGFRDDVAHNTICAFANVFNVKISKQTVQTNIALFNNSDGQHLKFKNTPIDGTARDFMKLLKCNYPEYTIYRSYDDKINIGSYKGGFAGYKDCIINIWGTELTHTAYVVEVVIREGKRNWTTLKNQYDNLKYRLEKKYKISSSRETFIDGYKNGDGNELKALKEGKCRYYTFFKLENGDINLEISRVENAVTIMYTDKINNELDEREVENAENLEDIDL